MAPSRPLSLYVVYQVSFLNLYAVQIMFLNGFYLFAASATLLVVALFVTNEAFSTVLGLPLSKRVTTMMLAGVSMAVGCYVSAFIG